MKKAKLIMIGGLLSAVIATPLFASEKDDDDDRRSYKDRYKEHYQERHNMNMSMMEMLAETMEILRDLNHKPSDKEKEHLSQMIKDLDKMMERHREMGKDTMERMERRMGDDDDRRHMMRDKW